LIIAPVFFAAGTYLTLKHLVLEFGETYSLIQPAKLYIWAFISAAIVSLVMQGVGGALGASGRSLDITQVRMKIALAGIIFQVISLSVFSLLFTFYFVRVYNNRMNLPRGTQGLTKSSRFRSYFVAVVVAILTVSFRCIYRIPELGGSYRNAVSRSQIDFVVLNGIIISIAILALTLAHPAIAFMGCPRRRFRRERQSLNLRVGNQSLCWSQRRAPSAQLYRRVT
jgi:hypothetical protein